MKVLVGEVEAAEINESKDRLVPSKLVWWAEAYHRLFPAATIAFAIEHGGACAISAERRSPWSSSRGLMG